MCKTMAVYAVGVMWLCSKFRQVAHLTY